MKTKQWRKNSSDRYFAKYLSMYIEIQSIDCHDCKKYLPLSMEFDHLPGFLKIDKISNMFFGKRLKWEIILVEIKKCQILCGNCHKIRTHLRLKEKYFL